jgi:hypothetical protein
MDVDEVEPRRRAPMPEEAWFDVCERERLFQQRVVVEINLTDGEVVMVSLRLCTCMTPK